MWLIHQLSIVWIMFVSVYHCVCVLRSSSWVLMSPITQHRAETMDHCGGKNKSTPYNTWLHQLIWPAQFNVNVSDTKHKNNTEQNRISISISKHRQRINNLDNQHKKTSVKTSDKSWKCLSINLNTGWFLVLIYIKQHQSSTKKR